MSDPKFCACCGAVLDAADEPCPRCLLELGRAAASADAETGGSVHKRKKRAVPSLSDIAAQFPELEIQALVGEGGMGAVYRARQPKIDRAVALKILALDPSDDPTFTERFRREALVLARLDHPNVVKLYDFGDRNGLFYLVLEFVDGTNLRSLMKQNLLTPKQALAVVPQMCEALQFAHDEGVIHRDIKPENVLIDAKGRVKIADFGLAKIVDADPRDVSLTEVGQVMGTPHYMAPEQLRGAADVDHRADIYSLGVVLYEMLTGELPRGKFDLPSKHVHVDVRLDEIVLKSLERAPERRYQHAIDVKTDVESVEKSADGAPSRSVLVGLALKRRRKTRGDHRARGDRPQVVVYIPNRPWQYFVAFLMLWPLAGSAFNAGIGWFIGAMVLVAAMFWSSLEREIRVRPELDALLRSESRGMSAARQLTALALIVCGLGALCLGHIALFDDFATNYRPGPIDPAAMTSAQAFETKLLPEVQSLGVPLAPQSIEFVLERFDPLDREAIFHQPWLLFLALVSCLSAGVVFGSRPADLLAWRGWRIPVSTMGSLLGSLLVVHGACAVVRVARHDGAPLVHVLAESDSRSMHDGGIDEVSQRVRLALVQRGHSISATGTWALRERDSGSPAGKLELLFADPASVFERWRMTWAGPRRTEPHAVIAVRGADGPCMIDGDLGDVRQGSTEQHAWREWYSRLLL
jgi:tRNA A-37 threonylcarbamoyl transferase component Bud32